MPWSLLIRLLSGLVFFTWMRRRRAATLAMATGETPKPLVNPARLRRRAREVTKDASVLARLAIAAGLLVSALALGVAGTTLVVAGPHWLGITTLVVTAIAIGSAAIILRGAQRAWRNRHRRVQLAVAPNAADRSQDG